MHYYTITTQKKNYYNDQLLFIILAPVSAIKAVILKVSKIKKKQEHTKSRP